MVYDKANSMVQTEVTAPAWLHRYIIGRKGANINKITEEYPLVRAYFDLIAIMLLMKYLNVV